MYVDFKLACNKPLTGKLLALLAIYCIYKFKNLKINKQLNPRDLLKLNEKKIQPQNCPIFI